MKILYISVHGVLEWQELKLFTELGHECFSTGEFRVPVIDPKEEYLRKRPSITEMSSHPELENLVPGYPDTNINPELLKWCDLIYIMHAPEVLNENWDKFKSSGKPVVWRSIGQSTIHVENTIRKMRYEGMKIVRMSPMEENITGYVGSDALIRFYVDSEELNNWNGNTKRIVNVTQSLLGRRIACHYEQIMQIMQGFPSIIYGSGNNDLGSLNGGELPYELLKGALRDNRVFIHAGTFPSPYTLSPIDALCTGIPIVSIGSNLAEKIEVAPQDQYNYFEWNNILINGENGFISDSINELRDNVHQLLEDHTLAQKISIEGRKTALKLFNKETIAAQWQQFLQEL